MSTVALAKKVRNVETEIRTRPIIGPDSAGILMTPEEFDALEPEYWDENYRYQLINGVLVVTPPPLEEERDPNQLLGHLLLSYQEQHPEGRSLDKTLYEHEIRVRNIRRADRVIWAGLGRRPRRKKDFPTIIVEFVSAGKRNWLRDYVTKRDEYLARGVKEYWIINRFDHTMTVFQSQRKRAKKLLVKSAEVYRTPLLPGFDLPLGQLFALADSWEED